VSNTAELDELIAEITVDCYNEDEQLSGLLTAFSDELALPLNAELLDISVLVLGFDMRGSGRELTARCRHGVTDGEIALADLTFPAGSVAAWLHAAYRRFLGLPSRPASKPAGWTPSWR
jgi:hypothetical protein